MEHVLDAGSVHHDWDRGLEPALSIASGDVVHADLRMTAHEQLAEGASADEVAFDADRLYHLAGPIRVEGARPGDTLRVDVLELEPGEWGWTAIRPGLGLLPDEVSELVVRTFSLRERGVVVIAPGVRIPTAPFLGTMGVHPGEPAKVSALPPNRGGGNIDTRHLTAGSTLWLPIWCDGALFSCGDPHAAQGDGEVCLTGLECPMRATLRFTVERRSIPAPRFATAGPLLSVSEDAGHIGTMGIDPDLMEGARTAVRDMIGLLADEHGLTREDAYIVCSLAGDLKILEIVDAGVWNVGFTIPRSILP